MDVKIVEERKNDEKFSTRTRRIRLIHESVLKLLREDEVQISIEQVRVLVLVVTEDAEYGDHGSCGWSTAC